MPPQVHHIHCSPQVRRSSFSPTRIRALIDRRILLSHMQLSTSNRKWLEFISPGSLAGNFSLLRASCVVGCMTAPKLLIPLHFTFESSSLLQPTAYEVRNGFRLSPLHFAPHMGRYSEQRTQLKSPAPYVVPPPPLIIRQKTILRRGARQSHQMRRSHVLRCHCSRRGRVNDDGVVPAQGTRSDTRRRRFRRLMRRRRQRRARRRSRFGRYRRPSACVLSRADKAVSYPCQRGDSQFLSRQPII